MSLKEGPPNTPSLINSIGVLFGLKLIFTILLYHTLREEILVGRNFSRKKIWRIWQIPKNYKFGGYEKNKMIAEFNLANDQNNTYFFELKNMFYKYKRKS